MKNALLFSLMLILIGGVVFSEQGTQFGQQAGKVLAKVIDNRNATSKELAMKTTSSYTDEYGNSFDIEISDEAKVKIRNRDAEAGSELNLEIEPTESNVKLTAVLSNGQKSEIKVMPDTASKKALEVLKLKNCNPTNNCTITLKEAGFGNQVNALYEIQAEKHARILWLFEKKMPVKCQISAESSDVINIKEPWWAFLATEPLTN